jgi:hypothetical protein
MGIRSWALIAWMGLTLAGCGSSPDAPPSPNDSTSQSLTGTGADSSASSGLTGNSTASAAPTLPPLNREAVPNPFLRYIGRNDVRSGLFNPLALATDRDHVLVADGDRQGPQGACGAVLEFDGLASDASAPLGFPYSDLTESPSVKRLSPHPKALAASSRYVFVSDDTGLYGYMRDSRFVLNFGRPLANPCDGLALAGTNLWVAQGGQVFPVPVQTLIPDPATVSFALAARSLTANASGSVYAATATGVVRVQASQITLSFGGQGTDGRGPGFEAPVAAAGDPRNGDVYVLDRHAVVRFDAYGRFLTRFGAGLVQEGASLAIGAQGEVFVADRGSRQVLQFEPGH